MNFTELLTLFQAQQCIALYAKRLAANDNSKNQVYFGPDFAALNLFPNKGPVLNEEAKTPNYKAALDFYWMNDKGQINSAPRAQLILYPDYPEVRFSGFLKGAVDAPNELLASRLPDRILFMGITPDRRIVGYVMVAAEMISEVDGENIERIGVFSEITVHSEETRSSRDQLLSALRGIHEQGWITSKQLRSDGLISGCAAPQCGGFTLEAELGIPKNSKGAPDFLGYEVKQHQEKNFERISSHKITLLTPNPRGGYYKDKGSEAFIRRFGYADRNGKPDRLNFGGVHRVGVRHHLTGLELTLKGYDPKKGTFEANGAIQLLTEHNEVAAAWSFEDFLKHWQAKHAKAVYVPSQKKDEPARMYRYGHTVRIGEQTDFLTLLRAFHSGAVHYDPALKIENASTDGATKKDRNQFRIDSRALDSLYKKFESVSLTND